MTDCIFNEDCLEGMKRIPDGSVDMVLCDPPYGTTSNVWDVKLPTDKVFEQYLRVCKENAAIVLFSQMPFGAELIMSQPKLYRYEWIWEKPMGVGFLNAYKMPLRCHENILVFYRKLPTYNPQYWYSTPYTKKKVKAIDCHCYGSVKWNGITENKSVDGKRYPRDVLHFNKEFYGYSWSLKKSVRLEHPTQKPIPLLEYLIKTYTNEGETVLDNCMGSGSTAVAAINTGRHFIGFETEPKYFEIANRRIEEAWRQASGKIKDSELPPLLRDDADDEIVLEGFI